MKPTRWQRLHELQRRLGPGEATEQLLDWVRDAWETYDLLIDRVGRSCASQVMNTQSLSSSVADEQDIDEDLDTPAAATISASLSSCEKGGVDDVAVASLWA